MSGDPDRQIKIMYGAWGYGVADVDDLLARIWAELDRGQSAGSLLQGAALTRARFTWRPGYDVDAVDWFLDQLARTESGCDPNEGPTTRGGTVQWSTC